MNFIVKLDLFSTRFFNGLFPHNSVFDTLFSFLSLRGNSIIIWIAILSLLILFEGKRDKRFIVYFVASALITALAVNMLIKNVVRRPRPIFTEQTTNCPKDYSFPSGHASTAFAASTVFSFFDRKRKWFYHPLAFFIGVSRIYLGCHYVIDVIAGSVLGFLISSLLLGFEKYRDPPFIGSNILKRSK